MTPYRGDVLTGLERPPAPRPTLIEAMAEVVRILALPPGQRPPITAARGWASDRSAPGRDDLPF